MIFTFIQSAGASFAYLLDDYPSAWLARSISRLLKSDYAGSAIRIRRSSDNTELDIGFAANELDQSAITSFVGANSAYLVKVYDQSGNGRDWVQATQANQPRIVNAGTLETKGGKPAGFWDGSDDVMVATVGAGYANSSMSYHVIYLNKDSAAMTRSEASVYYNVFQNGSGTVPDQNVGTPAYFKNGSSISATRDAMYDNFINTQALLSVTGLALADPFDNSGVIEDSYSGFAFGGWIQEEVFYNSSSNSQSGIEANIKTYYGL